MRGGTSSAHLASRETVAALHCSDTASSFQETHVPFSELALSFLPPPPYQSPDVLFTNCYPNLPHSFSLKKDPETLEIHPKWRAW